MAVEQVQWPEDVPFTSIPITSFDAGTTSDVLTLRIFSDRNDPGSGVVRRDNFFSVVIQDPGNPLVKLTNGIAPLDQKWTEVRFTDSEPTLEPFVTAFTSIGSDAILRFPELLADTWRQVEIRFRVPSYATTLPYTFFFQIHTGERAFALGGVQGIDTERGVLHGFRDHRNHFFTSGGQVTASAIPDDFINIARGRMVFNGAYQGWEDTTEQIDDFDGDVAPVQLAIGESYWLMVSRDYDGLTSSVDLVKGLLGSPPVKPALPDPLNFLWTAYAQIHYNAGGPPAIDDADIEMTENWRHFYHRQLGGLDIILYGGDAVFANSWVAVGGPENLTLTANTTNRVWLNKDGSYLITTGTSPLPPEQTSDLLYEFVTDPTQITSVLDGRNFQGQVRSLILRGPCPVVVGIIDDHLRFDQEFYLYNVAVQLDDNPGAGTDSVFDIEIDGVSVFPDVGLRPAILPLTGRTVSSVPDLGYTLIRRDSVIEFKSIQYSGGVLPPGTAKCILTFMRV